MADSKKILNEKVNSIVKDLSSIEKTMESLNSIKKIIQKDVKAFGNGCHVVLPKEFLNKKAKVIIT
ncbi:MAG: DUF2080 family transposase-associated protein [Candidatus Pacearchaeota archaeon]|jgi:putative transposon-encoded protein